MPTREQTGGTDRRWHLVGEPDEAATVARIVELHQAGRSLPEIGAALEAEGRRAKRGATTWPPATIARIVLRAGN